MRSDLANRVGNNQDSRSKIFNINNPTPNQPRTDTVSNYDKSPSMPIEAMVVGVFPYKVQASDLTKCDNFVREDNAIFKDAKMIVYESSGGGPSSNSKEKMLPKFARDISKDLPESDPRYKLYCARLIQGIGGGKIIVDASAVSSMPTKGDIIEFTTIEADSLFSGKNFIIKYKAESKTSVTSEPEKTSKDAAKGEKTFKTGEKFPKAKNQSAPIRLEIKKDLQKPIGSESWVSAAEWRAVLEPKFREVAKKLFLDSDEIDVFVANSLINSWNESASSIEVDGSKQNLARLKIGNWIFSHPPSSSTKKYEAEPLVTSTNCDRPDYSPKCKDKYGKPGPDPKKPYPAGTSADFEYARFTTIEDSIIAHFEYYKAAVDKNKKNFFSVVTNWPYDYKYVLKYGTISKLMYLEKKIIQGKTMLIATEDSYKKLLDEKSEKG